MLEFKASTMKKELSEKFNFDKNCIDLVESSTIENENVWYTLVFDYHIPLGCITYQVDFGESLNFIKDKKTNKFMFCNLKIKELNRV